MNSNPPPSILENIVVFFISDPITAIANFFSLIGIIATILVLRDVKKIKGFYLFRGTIKNLLDNFEIQRSQFGQYLQDVPGNKNLIGEVLAKLEAILKNITPKVDGTTKQSVSTLLKQIQEFRKTSIYEEDTLRRIHIEMAKTFDELKYYQEDKTWEAKL